VHHNSNCPTKGWAFAQKQVAKIVQCGEHYSVIIEEGATAGSLKFYI